MSSIGWLSSVRWHLSRVGNTGIEYRDPGIDFNTETAVLALPIPVFGYLAKIGPNTAKIGPKTTKIDQKMAKKHLV